MRKAKIDEVQEEMGVESANEVTVIAYFPSFPFNQETGLGSENGLKARKVGMGRKSILIYN